MSDLREKEPEIRHLDFTRDTYGNRTWEAEIHVWPYSSLRNESVYSKKVSVTFRAKDMRHAAGFSESIATTIKAAHDVWETGVDSIKAIRP